MLQKIDLIGNLTKDAEVKKRNDGSEYILFTVAANETSGEVGLDALFGGFSFADDFDPEHKASEEMADLLGGMLGGNDDLSEINDLLSKADNLPSSPV